ncbi:MAG: NUDIX domain-containing protein [Candidatus Gottesmanbacteria bacterium]|nr:NUDIX domain-containing protein [Candidatus Gottesmanbacteria bacterium]
MITCIFEDGGKGSLRHVVVHGILEHEGKLLLVKRTGPILETGKWSLPSGFLSRDETAEQAVIREIKEETGWDSAVIALFRINTNPNRPHEDRQNISIEFLLRPLKETGVRDHENSKVEWIPIDALLPFDQFAFDHGESIKLYLDYRKRRHPLPLLA